MPITNQIKTAILLALLTAILLWIGNFWGTAGLTIAFIFVLAMNGLSYFFSDRLVLRMYRAKEASKAENPGLHKMVENVCRKAEIPKPKIFLIPSEQPNAFATGRNPKHASIAFTKGILGILNEDELKGVISHEISHIKNRDILIGTVAATIAGVIGYVAMLARWGAIFGGIGGRDDRNGGGWVELIVLGILMPLIATLIQLAISRSREYLADETGARTVHDSKHLASALQKIEAESKRIPMRLGNPETAHLFISSPFKLSGLLSLLSTHPPVKERVKRLNKLKF